VGYASTLEVIRERLEEALAASQSMPGDVELASDCQRASFEKALSALLKVVCEARSYLDIATDPALDVAQNLSAEREKNRSLASKLRDAQETAVQLKNALDSERSRTTKLSNELDCAKANLRRTEKALEKAFADNPEGVLGAYSGGQIRPIGDGG